MAALRGTSYGGSSRFRFAPSRDTIRSYAQALDSEELSHRSNEMVFWDRVVSVTPSGTEEVYDLTVPGHQNWCCDGVITHNSGEIEQEADVVMFLWNKEKDDAKFKPIVSTILTIEKHRHGQTGDVFLAFNKPAHTFTISPKQGIE
jgi:replicative DNA helicase